MPTRLTSTLALLSLGMLASYAADAPPVAPPAVPPAVAAIPAPVLLDLSSPTLLTRVKPAGQPDASPTVVENAGVRSLQFACQAPAAWPGINLLPESAAWNLSASATIRVFFGSSWGKPAYQIDATRISQIQIYAVKPGVDCVLRVTACTVFGKAGDKSGSQPPKAINTKHVPIDGAIVSFAKGLDAARFKLTGTLVTSSERDGKSRAVITAPAAPARAEALYRPAKGFDLRDFHQATFTLRNPGTTAIRVACRVDGTQDDNRAVSEADIAPGQSCEVIVPFASAQVWQGVTPGAQPAAKTNAPFLGAPEEQSSLGLISDAISAFAVTILNPQAGSAVEWEGVTAAVGAMAVLPAWAGTRPPVDGEWVSVFADEFNGTALDTTHWTPRLPWIGPIPWELQRYNDRNVNVSDGCLVIHCDKQTGHLYDNPAWPARDYTTGAVTTYDKWSMHYGYVEARMKVPQALGLWPAFWTMPDRGAIVDGKPLIKNQRRDTGGDGMEMDIMEHLCRFGPFRYNIACHWDGYGKDHKSVGTSRIYSQPDADGFFTAGLLWEPGKLTWYCNGNPVGTWSDARVGSAPASLKFTVQMGGWAGYEVDDAALPDDFKIDWVRVWQRKTP